MTNIPKSRFNHIPYTPNRLPPRLTWTIPVQIPRIHVALLCQRLHSMAMDRNGASFYYPNEARTQTVCRYEWHLRLGSERFALRVGLAFRVGPEDLTKIEVYATTRDAILGLVEPALDAEKAEVAQREAIETLSKALGEAETLKSWLFVFHLEMPYRRGFSKKSSFGEEDITFLPTRILRDHKRVSAIIIRAEAETKIAGREVAFAKLTTICALLTLSEGHRYGVARLQGNTSRPVMQTIRSTASINEGRLYPVRRIWPKLEEMDSLVPIRFSWVWSAYNALDPNAAENFSASLFAYYGATIGDSDFATLSAVGYAAALSALAAEYKSKCEGNLTCSQCGGLNWPHDLVSESAAINNLVVDLLDIRDTAKAEEVREMLLRVHRKQRSSFVHGARHRHSEYGQEPLPSALPTEKAAVQERLIYEEDLLSLSAVTRNTLLSWLARFTGKDLDRELFNVRFTVKHLVQINVTLPNLSEAQMIQ